MQQPKRVDFFLQFVAYLLKFRWYDLFECRYWKFNYWRFHWTTTYYIIILCHHKYKWLSEDVYLQKYFRNRSSLFDLKFVVHVPDYNYCWTFELQWKSGLLVSSEKYCILLFFGGKYVIGIQLSILCFDFWEACTTIV